MEELVTNNVPEQEPQAPITEEIVEIAPKKKLSTKMLVIIGASLAALIALIVILFIPSKFERVKNEAVDIAGQVSSRGKDNFTIDTYPYEDTNMSASLIAALAPSTQENALKAIKHVNSEFGFSSSLYDDMMHTSAIMGRQSAENKNYRVTWTYHPSEGLEVTYYKK